MNTNQPTGDQTMQNDHTLTATERNEMNWTKGTVQANGQTYTYSVKHFDEPSCYGIRNGRVSKLEIRLAGPKAPSMVVLNYSRGWDVRAQNAETRMVRDAILKRFN